MRFYCPRCWQDFDKDLPRCPYCDLDIHAFWKSKDYIEKLIVALDHPEKETPIRAAWLLGPFITPPKWSETQCSKSYPGELRPSIL